MTLVQLLCGVLLDVVLMTFSAILTVLYTKNRGLREKMIGWSLFLLNAGLIGIFLITACQQDFPSSLRPFVSFIILSFILIGWLILFWGSYYYFDHPLDYVLLLMVAFIGGATWGYIVADTTKGTGLLFILARGKITELTWHVQLLGILLTLASALMSILIQGDVKKRRSLAQTHPRLRIYSLLFILNEMGMIMSTGAVGLALLMKNELTSILFFVAIVVLVVNITSIQILLGLNPSLLFPTSLEIIQAISGDDASIGWAFYVFGPMGPELSFCKMKNLSSLPTDERNELIQEFGIKLLSMPSFRGEYDRSIIRLTLTRPLEADLLFITTFVLTRDCNKYDVRFEQKPYAGFLLLVRNKTLAWILDHQSAWDALVNSMVKDKSLEELSEEMFERGIHETIRDIVSGKTSILRDDNHERRS